MKKLFLLLLAVLSVSLCASAQMRTVTGTVLDAENDEPIIGASVTVGGGYGAATDVDGNFTLKVPAATTHLKVSYVGYKAQDVKIGNGPVVVRLYSDSELLDEVIAVAYGKSTRAAFTGSAAVVSAAEIEEAQVSNPLNAIKGKVAGVQMSNASGAPGSDDPSVLIRGISSISAGTSPLIILDGTPFSGALQTINTNDIESMTVLKDAAANALYGARGANGVIIITTKRAKLGEATVTLDVKIGSNSRAARDYDYIKDPAMYYEAYYKSLYNLSLSGGATPANSSAWANRVMFADMNSNDGAYSLGYNVYTVPGGQALIGLNGKLNPNAKLGRVATYNGQQYYLTPDNWVDATYKNSLRQDYNLSISKGTDSGDFYFSVGYLDNEGITPCSGFERFTARLAASTQAKSWLKASVNMNYSHYDMDSYGSDEGSTVSSGNPFASALQIAPIYPLYIRNGNGEIKVDDNGYQLYDYGGGANAGYKRPALSNSNPIGTNLLDTNRTNGDTFNGTGSLEVRFLKDFTITSNNSVDFFAASGTSFSNPFYGPGQGTDGVLSKSTRKTLAFTLQQLVNWSHLYNGVHKVEFLAGHEFYKTRTNSLSGTKNSMFDPTNLELSGMINLVSTGSAESNYNNEGWIFRGQYDYDNRVFASASYRRDASSRFHPKHRWGNFWSAGAAWLISSEDFMSDIQWLDMLKIKASYGSQGNDNIANFLYTNQYELVSGANGTPAIVPDLMGNETITWETQGNFNAGFEFAVLDNRLSGSFEGFYRKTSDMLYYFPLPPSIGWSGYYDNIGDMANKGIELELHGTPIKTKDWRWDIDFNITWYKNRITRLPEERRSVTTATGEKGYSNSSYFFYEGGSLYTYYIPKYAGVDDNGQSMWYMEKPILDSEGKDTGRTETTTTTQYSSATQYLCGTALAPVYGGFGTSLAYKDFDLSVNFAYQIGGQTYDGSYAAMMSSPTSGGVGSAIHVDVFNAWSPENPNSNIPRFQFGDNYSSSQSDRFLTNASYLSLQNINLGYTLPSKIANKLYLKSVRVSCSAENVFYWSKRQGMDPRLSMTGGGNNAYYSPIRTISGGINVTF